MYTCFIPTNGLTDEDAGLVACVNTGDGNKRSRGATSATGDADLGTRNVELGATIALSDLHVPSEVRIASEMIGNIYRTWRAICSARTRYSPLGIDFGKVNVTCERPK